MEAAGFQEWQQALASLGHLFGEQQQQIVMINAQLSSNTGYYGGTLSVCPVADHLP